MSMVSGDIKPRLTPFPTGVCSEVVVVVPILLFAFVFVLFAVFFLPIIEISR